MSNATRGVEVSESVALRPIIERVVADHLQRASGVLDDELKGVISNWLEEIGYWQVFTEVSRAILDSHGGFLVSPELKAEHAADSEATRARVEIALRDYFQECGVSPPSKVG